MAAQMYRFPKWKRAVNGVVRAVDNTACWWVGQFSRPDDHPMDAVHLMKIGTLALAIVIVGILIMCGVIDPPNYNW